MSGQNRLLTYSSTNSDQCQLRKNHVDDLEGNRPKTRLKQSHLSISCSNTELNDDVNHKHACSNTVLRDSGHPLNVPYTYLRTLDFPVPKYNYFRAHLTFPPLVKQ